MNKYIKLESIDLCDSPKARSYIEYFSFDYKEKMINIKDFLKQYLLSKNRYATHFQLWKTHKAFYNSYCIASSNTSVSSFHKI